MRLFRWLISIIALLLVGVVVVGFALPGTWEAGRDTTINAAPEVVFGYLDSVEGWAAWAPLAEVDGSRSGPAEGPGATLRWDDAEWGEGEWTITEAEASRRVAYEVRVEDGALVTHGEVVLTPTDAGTRVEWTESGDFGWNPVLAYMALGMERLQGREMEKSLTALTELIAGGPPS